MKAHEPSVQTTPVQPLRQIGEPTLDSGETRVKPAIDPAVKTEPAKAEPRLPAADLPTPRKAPEPPKRKR